MSTLEALVPHGSATTRRSWWQRVGGVEALAAALALLGWGIVLTHATGGQAPYTLALVTASALPLLFVSGAARRVPLRALAFVLLPGAVALGLNSVSATGWSGLGEAAAWWYAALLGLGVVSYARTPARRQLVAALVLLVGTEQMYQAWFAWWGSGDRQALMVGTFFWHNPFAAFQAAISLVALAVAMRATGWLRRLGLVLAPWLAAGVWLSGSRAGLALWVLAVLALVALGARTWRQAATVGAASVGSLALAWLLASPVLMGGAAGSGGSGVGAAGRTEAAEGNFLIRLDYWRAAARLASHHLWTGSGFGSFAGAGAPYMPADKSASSAVHNGWLQAMVDGGLVLALPVIAVTGWLAIRAVRRLLSARHAGADPVAIGAASGVVLLLAHALFDLDWAYPALLALFAVLVGLLPWRLQAVAAPRSGRLSRWGVAPIPVVAVLAAVGVLTVGAALVDGAQRVQDRPAVGWQRVVDQVLPVRALAARLPSESQQIAVLLAARTLAPPAVRDALAQTVRASADDPVLAQYRAFAMVALGDVDAGLAESAARYPAAPRPKTVLARAEVLVAAGDTRGAVDLVTQALGAAQRAGSPAAPDLAQWLSLHPASAEASTQGGDSTSVGTDTFGEATR